MAAAPSLRRSDSALGDFSPLKHFVLAKKKIGDVFEQLLNYVEESSEFVAGEVFWLLLDWNGAFLSEIICCVCALLFLFVYLWAETCGNTALENIAKQDQSLEIQAYADKLSVIKEVLARRHMKVAFFGR